LASFVDVLGSGPGSQFSVFSLYRNCGMANGALCPGVVLAILISSKLSAGAFWIEAWYAYTSRQCLAHEYRIQFPGQPVAAQFIEL